MSASWFEYRDLPVGILEDCRLLMDAENQALALAHARADAKEAASNVNRR